MSVNKFFKQSSETSNASENDSISDSDRLVWEMRNLRQYYHNRIPNLTPSSTVLNSPDLEGDRLNEHYSRFAEGMRDGSDEGDHRYKNRMVPGHSPTSSLSSSSEQSAVESQSKKNIIGALQIANLHESPRRLGETSHETTHDQRGEKSQEFQRLSMRSPSNFPKRAPGFPKVSLIPFPVCLIFERFLVLASSGASEGTSRDRSY